MPDYNTARVALGLAPITDWSDLTSDDDLIDLLTELYPGGVNTLDPYVGGLLEGNALFHALAVINARLLSIHGTP